MRSSNMDGVGGSKTVWTFAWEVDLLEGDASSQLAQSCGGESETILARNTYRTYNL